MKKYAAILFLFLTIFSLIFSLPSLAQDFNESEVKQAFLKLPESERKAIQWVLKSSGKYDSDLDGLWGTSTSSALQEFYIDEYTDGFGATSVTSTEEAETFLSVIYYEFGGESATCNGCNPPLEDEDTNASLEVQVDLGAKCGNYTTISGVCWALSRDEMMEVLSAKGFQCGPAGIISFTMNPDFTCTNASNNAVAFIYDKSIAFDCLNFNTCGYNVVQTAQMIIDNGILNEMQPEVSTLENGTPIVSYCGIANDGQKVCVSDYPILVRMQRPVFVFLDGRNIGQGPISFE